MDTADIQKYFSVNHASGRTLTSQLENRIARFIEENKDGTLLPPEETLAKVLNVSRVTVRNALKPFLEKGLILREVRKGTRICKSTAGRDESEPIDPLALGMVWRGVPRKVLRFLSYETLPLQQSFWNQVVWEYTRQNPEVQVKIIPMKSGMLSQDLSDLLREKQIDLFLHSYGYSGPLSELAQPLPEELRSRMSGPEFLTSGDVFRGNPAFDYLLPLNVSSLSIAWNTELAERIGWKNVSERLEKEDLLDLICEAAALLPDGYSASGHAWDLLALAGFPNSGSEMDQMEKRLFQMEKVLKTPKACIVSPSHSLEELLRDFNEGHVLFLITTMTRLFAKGEPAVPFELFPYHAEPECRNPLMPLNIAVFRFSNETEEAVKFMAFLLSPQVQKWSVSIKKAAPVRKENFYEFMKKMYQYTPEQADPWLQKHNLFKSQFSRMENYHRFTTYDSRGELEDIAAGRCKVEKAVSLLRIKYNDQLKILQNDF
ncbi:MAG: extracellular solute-binding protein [Lentisphaeria bacterium]|nr:extracellular solute-binding protein [Lentisphaeria bacterium]